MILCRLINLRHVASRNKPLASPRFPYPSGRHTPAGTGVIAVRVLLVEDDELVRMCLAEALADAGISVTEASDAEQALGLASAAAPPAVLVSDVNLGPGMDGIALAAEAHRRWPALRVVLISGIPGNQARCHLRTSVRFLPKPFTDADLLRAISELTDDAPSAPPPGGA